MVYEYGASCQLLRRPLSQNCKTGCICRDFIKFCTKNQIRPLVILATPGHSRSLTGNSGGVKLSGRLTNGLYMIVKCRAVIWGHPIRVKCPLSAPISREQRHVHSVRCPRGELTSCCVQLHSIKTSSTVFTMCKPPHVASQSTRSIHFSERFIKRLLRLLY